MSACEKRRYPSKLAAKLALVRAQAKQEHPNHTVAAKRRESRFYWCPQCKGWHLTSK